MHCDPIDHFVAKQQGHITSKKRCQANYRSDVEWAEPSGQIEDP